MKYLLYIPTGALLSFKPSEDGGITYEFKKDSCVIEQIAKGWWADSFYDRNKLPYTTLEVEYEIIEVL